MEIVEYTSSNEEGWDSLVQRSRDYSFFHCMAWARVLEETYDFSSRYFAAFENGEFAALPLMIVRTPLRGRKAVCLPFSDFCGAVSSRRDILVGLLEHTFGIRDVERWNAIEIRNNDGMPEIAPCARYWEHIIQLTNDVQASLRSSTWRNIQHAERLGVRIERSTSKDSMETYYRLHCISRRRRGMPPQPWRFFANIQEHIIERGQGFVLRAKYEGRTVAAAMFLHFGTKAVYKFGASVRDEQRIRPNNLVIWEAINWYKDNGFHSLSLGRTDPKDEGLMQFKNGWGGECREVEYCRWPSRCISSSPSPGRRVVHSLARKMPLSVLKLAGNLLYRYLG
jgi:hypothetical protein